MFSTPESNQTINNSGRTASHFQKTVCLHDWWLIRADNDFNGRKLAVAGLTSKPEEPVRMFSSAAIRKRYDVFTLETADGICVVIRGFINKSRTTDNGFSDEVFKHFVFGFPPDWETFAKNCFEGEAFDSAAMGNVTDMDKLIDESKTADARMNDSSPIDTNSLLYENTPNKVGKEKVNVTLRNFGSKSSDRLRNQVNVTPSLVDSHLKTGIDIPEEGVKGNEKEEKASRKAKRKILFDAPVNPCTRKEKRKSIISPECLSYGRSRSGRLLLPTMEFWRNQLPVYDADRKLSGIQEGLPLREPPRGPYLIYESTQVREQNRTSEEAVAIIDISISEYILDRHQEMYLFTDCLKKKMGLFQVTYSATRFFIVDVS